MKHGIKQKSTILIFALVLMAFVTHSIHHHNLAVAQFVFVAPVKNPQVFAQAAYDKFKRILTRDDLLPLLPDVLTALKDDKFDNPNLSVEIFFTPPLLRQHIPNIDERFITLLDVPEIIEMFTDFEMTRLYGFPAAIDALLDLLAPHLKQVTIDQAFVNAGRYGTLIITGSGMQIGESAPVGTTHTLIFTIINAEGNPVPGLPLNYSINPLDGTAATATFNPATATTNQDGKVYAEITFGPNPGNLRLIVGIDTQQIVEFVELELTQGNTNVNNVTMKGLEHGFARTGTTQTLVFKATDANGIPVSGEELMFGARSEYSSAATATFDPATATTDQNGEARTQITFGAKPGGINLTVQSGPAIEQVNITASQVNLGSQVEGTFTGLQVGDSVDVGSIHTLVFTATDLRGRPVSGLPIAFTFGGIPLELEAMFDPATATTDRRGQVRTQVTFGEEPGDFELIVSMDPQRVIVFSEPEFRLGGTNIANLKIQGMEEGFAQPGSSINLVLTATDASGRPVAGEELVFGVGIIPDSQAMVESLQPVKVKTNKKGKAQTRVMFGPEPGEIRLTVKSGVIIHSVLFDVAPYGMMEFKGLQIADGVKVNSTHDLVFTVTNENGKPVPWLPLQLSAVDLDVFAQAATFTPTPRVVTNKNGKARTSITFGDVHGDVRLIATVDRQQIVEFPNPNPKITLNNSKIARLTVKGIEHGFARVGSTRNLLFTAMDKNGNPVKGVKFGFGFRSQLDSNATATFDPATVTTDENGQAETQVTFGQNPGGLRFTIQPPANKITIQSVSSDVSLSLLSFGELTYKGFEIGDTFKIGSTEKLVFTVNNENGNAVPWLPLRFGAQYLDGTQAMAKFDPAEVSTNKNGIVRTSVTFTGEPVDIRLMVGLDRQQIVEFLEPELTLDSSSIAQLTINGIEQGFARLGSTRTFVLTATDANGAPVVGAELTFSFESEPDNDATATFSAETVTTDKSGKAETEATFGSEPGSLRFTVKPVDGVKVWHVAVYSEIPGLLSYKLESENFEIGDTFDTNSTHTVVYTVIDDDKPVPELPLIFDAQSFDGKGATATFTPATATTDENGMVKTSVTFGSKSGEIELSAKVDEEQIIEIVEVDFTLDDSGIDKLVVRGADADFERVGTTRTLFFTATDENGDPVVGAELVFGIKPHSSATAVFNPTKAITDENGQAQTDITFGEKSGLILMTVKPTEESGIHIPDSNLRSAINLELGKKREESITEAEMLTLTEFSRGVANIQDLTGLEFAKNLTTLDIRGSQISQISDISPLAGLKNLTSLNLESNRISDVSPLASLTNLTFLELRYNTISDISPLAGLENLTSLNLWENYISDVSPLAGLINLTYLNLFSNDISDVSPLAGLVNLTSLNLGYNDISDVGPLAGLTNLTSLDLGSNDISDVFPLAGLVNLTSLNLWSNEISDVSPLVGLTNLTFLVLQYNQIENFSPITGLIPNLNVYRNSPQKIQGVVIDLNLPVTIPDSNLRAAIGRVLGKPLGATITQTEMQSLTSLTVAEGISARVDDLTGIEFAANLTELNLRNTYISDLSLLSSLTSLETLDLNHNEISDISALSGLTNLMELNLEWNEISDISALGGLMNLMELNLSANEIINVSVLGGLTNLMQLDLEANEISNVSALGGLTNLMQLNLAGNEISDISALGGLTNLVELHLAVNKIINVSALGGLTNLETLWLDRNRISDISALSGLTNLMELNLFYNDISDVSPLVGLTNLTDLNLDRNQISDFSPIAGLISNLKYYQDEDQRGGFQVYDIGIFYAISGALGKPHGATITHADMQTLTVLEARSSQIHDLTGLRFATNLTVLDLGRNKIRDISPLSGLTNLTELNLEENEITDISPLSGLTNLADLDLSENAISDISSLSGLTNLTRLTLYDNGISDISALSGLTNLTHLTLFDNAISDISSLSGLMNLRILTLSENTISDISSLSGLTSLMKLNLGYNGISDISALSGLTNLTDLDLGHNDISDISALSGLTNLETLLLDNNRISDVSPLSGLKNLRVLLLNFNEISDVSSIIELIDLIEIVELNGNPLITDIPLSLEEGRHLKNLPADPDVPVDIPDTNLRNLLSEKFGKTEGTPITRGDMAKFTRFGARGNSRYYEIQDLTGLEFAINLESLSLSEHPMLDMSSFPNLPKLTGLDLDSNNISDVSFLAGLTQLLSLSLDSNNISDVSPLAQFRQLIWLDLDSNNISDVSFLAGLTQLESLSLDSNNISDVSPLAKLRQLRELILSRNLIWDFSPIQGLINYNGDEQRLVVISGKRYSDQGVGVTEIVVANLGSGRLFRSHYPTESTHSIAWFVRKDGYPVKGLPLFFTATSSGGSSASASFIQSQVTTDSFGLASTYITFGENAGSIIIHVAVNYVVSKKTLNQSGASVYKYPDGNEIVLIKGLDLGAPQSGIIFRESYYEVLPNIDDYAPPTDGKHFKLMTQSGNGCGQTSARMLLYYYGVDVSQDTFQDVGNHYAYLTNKWIPDWFLDKIGGGDFVGTSAGAMKDGISGLGVPVDQYIASSPRDDLKYYISRSRPVIIVQRLSEIGYHHVVVVGYDTRKNAFLIADPNGFFYWANWDEWTKVTGPRGELEANKYVLRPPLLTSWRLDYLPEDAGNPFDAGYLPWEDWNGGVPDVQFALMPAGWVRSYRMFVPKAAPKYHHLESETHEIYVTGDEVLLPPWNWHDWKREKTFSGKVIAYSLVTETRHGDVRDVEVEGNKVILSGRIANGLPLDADIRLVDAVFFGAVDIVLTVYYDPSISAAPSIILPAPLMETALLPNYPNPFNPETWIPYHLAEPADVTLTIYSVDGKVVRRLDLGHQAAGYYRSKSRAAYWDGRNNVGERVASGIYFYTITAGDFAATKKMLILK